MKLTRRGTPYLRPGTRPPTLLASPVVYEAGTYAYEWAELARLVEVARQRRAQRQARGQLTLELRTP